MTGWLVFAGYLVMAFVGARCAARFMRRVDRRYDLPHEDWDGADWFLVIYTAIAWPVAIPIGHLMTRQGPVRSFLWLQRLLGGPRD